MRVLHLFVRVSVVISLLVAIASCTGYAALKFVPGAQAIVLRWRLTKIFKNRGHVVVWEKPVEEGQLARHLQVEIKKLAVASNGWQIPTTDHSRAVGQRLKNRTLVHVLEVKDVISVGSPLTIFLLEEPITSQRMIEMHTTDTEGRKVRIPPHRHNHMQYLQTAALVAWGDLTLFPLENYFSFDELRGRRLWIPGIIRYISFWGGSSSIGFIVLAMSGAYFLKQEQFRRWLLYIRAQWTTRSRPDRRRRA